MIKCNKDSRQLPEAILSIWPILDKKIRIDIALLRQMIQKKEIQKIHWTGTSAHIVNFLTKLGALGQLSLDSFETISLKKYYKYHNKLSFTPLLYLSWYDWLDRIIGVCLCWFFLIGIH